MIIKVSMSSLLFVKIKLLILCKLQNLDWRESNGMDTILNEDFFEYEIDYPTSSDGYDYEGRPGNAFSHLKVCTSA